VVDRSSSLPPGSSTRQMLTPDIKTGRARRPTTAGQRQPGSDPLVILLAAMAFVGLMGVALAVWFIYMRQFANGTGTTPFGSANLNAQRETAARLARAEATRSALDRQVTDLQDELERTRLALATAVARPLSPPPSAMVLDKLPLALILDAPVFKQERSLSCESSAAAMAANYHGVTLSEQEILGALPSHENPHIGFRGNVDGSYGGIDDYGVYAEPIAHVLEQHGLQVTRLKGETEAIRAQIRKGNPVIAWVTYNLQPQIPLQIGLNDGRVITLVPYEHTVLVVGYNQDGLWVNDPYGGTQEFYSESDFVRSFSYLDNMALAVGPPIQDR